MKQHVLRKHLATRLLSSRLSLNQKQQAAMAAQYVQQLSMTTTANNAIRQHYWTPENIDIATQGALLFFQVYYETYDEPTRRVEVRHSESPRLYDAD